MSALVGVVGSQDATIFGTGFTALHSATAGALMPEPVALAERSDGGAPARFEIVRAPDYGVLAVVMGRVAGSAGSPTALVDAYVRRGLPALKTIVGPYAAVFVSSTDGTATLARSASGQQPIYFARAGRGWAFGSTVGALIACPDVGFTLDRDALADYFHHGVIWGERTLAAGISILLPGCAVVLAPGSDPASPSSFVEWPRGGEEADEADAVEAIDRSLASAMSRVIDRDPDATICLSAGLDSRTLLAYASRAGTPPRCVTNGLDGSIEIELTARMCRDVGAEHSICRMGDDLIDDIEDLAQGVCAVTDGEADIMNMMMLHVGRRYRDSLGLSSVIRGHGGELMKLDDAYGFAMPDPLATSADHDTARKRLVTQLGSAAPAALAVALLGDDLGSAGRAASESRLGERYDLHAGEDVAAGQAAARLFLSDYNGRHTMNAMRCLGSSVDVALPFLDDDVVQATLAAPVGLRTSRRLQLALIERNRPSLLRIPNSAIRTTLTAGPWRRRLASLRFRVESRLGMHSTDVPERWLIERLGGLFERVLLDPRCLDRGLLVADEARRLVGASRDGDRRANALLGRATVTELFLRRLDAGDG